jgi:hypothetical protein
MVTRGSLEWATGNWPVGSSSEGPSSDFKKFLLFMREHRVNDGDLVLGHLVENLFESLNLVARKTLFFLEVL